MGDELVIRRCTSCRRRAAAPGRKRCERCNAHSRTYSAKLVDQGKCPKCRQPHEGPHRTCEKCLGADRLRRKRSPARGGKCPSCRKNKSVKPHSTCPQCRANNRKQRADRIAKGMCVRACGSYAHPGLRICLACREERMRTFDLMAAAAHINGTCINHKDRLLDARSKWYCTQCRDERAVSRRAKYRERCAAGLCPDCGKKAQPGHVYCHKHTR